MSCCRVSFDPKKKAETKDRDVVECKLMTSDSSLTSGG